MATRAPDRPTQKAARLVEANRTSALVYQSTSGDGCFYRLADGQTFDMSTLDCMSIRDFVPRWRHLEAA